MYVPSSLYRNDVSTQLISGTGTWNILRHTVCCKADAETRQCGQYCPHCIRFRNYKDSWPLPIRLQRFQGRRPHVWKGNQRRTRSI